MTIAGKITLPARRMVKAAHLLYFDQQDPVGRDPSLPRGVNDAPDRELSIIFIRPRPELFPDERCPRRALHVNHHAGGLS